MTIINFFSLNDVSEQVIDNYANSDKVECTNCGEKSDADEMTEACGEIMCGECYAIYLKEPK